MDNRAQKGYDYSRAGVAMVTLKTRKGMWLCRITQDSFTLTDIGKILLEHPRRVQVQLSRNASEGDWLQLAEELEGYLEQGYVFVSPFISPYERRLLHEVVAQGGRAIRLAHVCFGERYKPMGELFYLCCAGRLLEISVAGEFTRYARLDRAVCLRLNEVTEEIATTQPPSPRLRRPWWSQGRG